MGTQARKLALVVVNYASSGLLRTNLVRTAADSSHALVVVIDNFSSNAERELVRNLVRERGWIGGYPDENGGFGHGVNLGVSLAAKAGATDFLLLNPDASIDAWSVRALMEAAETDRRVVLAPKILDSSGCMWFGGADLYLEDGVTRGSSKRAQYPDAVTWPWITGACMLVTEEIWDATGGFDSSYFLYWEDVDFSARATAVGASLLIIDAATAVHDEGGTQREDPSASRAKSSGYYYYNIRNRMVFATKHLDDEQVRAWRRGARTQAREVLLRGGRRQFLRPWAPLSAAVRGVRDARRIADRHLRRGEVQ